MDSVKSMTKIPSLTRGNKDLCMKGSWKYMMTNRKTVLFTDESWASPNDPGCLTKGWVFNGDNCGMGIQRQQSGYDLGRNDCKRGHWTLSCTWRTKTVRWHVSLFMNTTMHFRDHSMHKPLCPGVRQDPSIILLIESTIPMVYMIACEFYFIWLLSFVKIFRLVLPAFYLSFIQLKISWDRHNPTDVSSLKDPSKNSYTLTYFYHHTAIHSALNLPISLITKSFPPSTSSFPHSTLLE